MYTWRDKIILFSSVLIFSNLKLREWFHCQIQKSKSPNSRVDSVMLARQRASRLKKRKKKKRKVSLIDELKAWSHWISQPNLIDRMIRSLCHSPVSSLPPSLFLQLETTSIYRRHSIANVLILFRSTGSAEKTADKNCI